MNVGATLLVIAFGVLAVAGGGLVTMLCFHIVDRSSRAQRPVRSVEAAASTLRGGAWIGALERIAIFSGLLIGWPEAIAIVLAVKGLGRYPELKNGDNSAVAERFIIGTFVSVLWACGCAGVAHWVIS